MRLGELISGLDASVALGRSPDVRVCDLTEDSRTVMPGSLFIARRGDKADGRAFIPQAVAAGAVAVLTDDPALAPPGPGVAVVRTGDLPMTSAIIAERFYGEPASKLRLIGVTGTNGKTTIAFLIHQILNELGVRCGLMGTVCIDDGTEVAPATLTTAPALEISRTLARMVEAGCKAAVMEVSSHALHQRRVGALRFDGAIFTNLTGDHLDYHGSMEAYAAAKRELFTMLRDRKDDLGRSRGPTAVVNADDPAAETMLSACKATPAGVGRVRCRIAVEPEGTSLRADEATARVVRLSAAGTRAELAGPWGSQTVDMPLVGGFNAMNALEAFAAVHGVFEGTPGVTPESIAGVLAHAQPPPGRLEPIAASEAPLSVFVDYAHTDDALRSTLTTLRRTMRSDDADGRTRALVCVFGCGGDRDRTKRPRMGRVAAELADQIIVTSDNPRTERPEAIIEEVLTGIPVEARGRVVVEPDRERAIRLAVRRAQPGDVIAVCGKGHEDYQILPDPEQPGRTITRHFDDREIARAALTLRSVPVRRPPSLLSGRDASDDDELSLTESIDATEALLGNGPQN